MNRKKILITALCLVCVFSLTVIAIAATPGGETDPVVTKSYVDQQIASIDSGAGGTFVATLIPKGKTVVGEAGCEIILRSGRAAAVAPGINGVTDITAGKDLKNGDPVTLEHLMIVPRSDGRGIKVEVDSYIMVRGQYTVQ